MLKYDFLAKKCSLAEFLQGLAESHVKLAESIQNSAEPQQKTGKQKRLHLTL